MCTRVTGLLLLPHGGCRSRHPPRFGLPALTCPFGLRCCRFLTHGTGEHLRTRSLPCGPRTPATMRDWCAASTPTPNVPAECLATPWMNTNRACGDIDGAHEAGGPLSGGPRSREYPPTRVGPFRCPGQGRECSQVAGAGLGAVSAVKDDPEAVEADLVAGRVACPGCGGPLSPWGFAS